MIPPASLTAATAASAPLRISGWAAMPSTGAMTDSLIGSPGGGAFVLGDVAPALAAPLDFLSPLPHAPATSTSAQNADTKSLDRTAVFLPVAAGVAGSPCRRTQYYKE